MKRVIILSAALFTGAAGMAQSSKLSVISGRMAAVSPTVKNVYLYGVEEGARTSVASVAINEEGEYAFALNNPKTGLYYLSLASEPERGKLYTRLYVKPGDNITVNISAKGDSATVTGGSTGEKLLDQWQQASFRVYSIGMHAFTDTSTYLSYFPAFEKLLPVAEQLKKNAAATDKAFSGYLSKLIDADLQRAALAFLYTPRTKHPSKEQYPAYYARTFQPGMYCDATLMEDGEGVKLLQYYTLHMLMQKDSADRLAAKATTYNVICNDTLKGLYIATGLAGYKTVEALEAGTASVKQYFLTDRLKDRYTNALKAVSTFKAGTAAHEFSYPDTAGRNYSLKKDLAGKVVYVDMWATWCGPCKAELPHLAEVEEEFKNENVVFVSISVDELKDKDKWKDFVKANKLGGLQLYAGGWQSDIASFYGVKAIPRFMLFDTKGNIVTVDAPRPSNAELKKLLRQTLAAKS